MEDFHEEGEGIVRALTNELKQIRSRDDLLVHADQLEELFCALVDVMIAARKFQESHAKVELLSKNKTISDNLRIELNRILRMEGGRAAIEQVQEKALNRLEASGTPD